MAVDSETLTLIGILIVAIVTPGPNNIIIFYAAASRGIRFATSLIAGVVSGSIILLLCTILGIDLMLKYNPHLQLPLSILGSTYLIWLGTRICMITTSFGSQDNNHTILASSWFALAAFQFVNPKSWILMSVVSTRALLIMHWASLVALLILIMVVCLILWACAGICFKKILQPSQLLWFNRVMGLTLTVFAMTLLWQSVR